MQHAGDHVTQPREPQPHQLNSYTDSASMVQETGFENLRQGLCYSQVGVKCAYGRKGALIGPLASSRSAIRKMVHN
jgi:hypothetical protein